jgi:hypothetical protein
MMVFAQILIDVVFVAALAAALGSLVYLVSLTVRERHLRPGLEVRAAKTASAPSPVSRAVERAHSRRAVLHRS